MEYRQSDLTLNPTICKKWLKTMLQLLLCKYLSAWNQGVFVFFGGGSVAKKCHIHHPVAAYLDAPQQKHLSWTHRLVADPTKGQSKIFWNFNFNNAEFVPLQEVFRVDVVGFKGCGNQHPQRRLFVCFVNMFFKCFFLNTHVRLMSSFSQCYFVIYNSIIV